MKTYTGKVKTKTPEEVLACFDVAEVECNADMRKAGSQKVYLYRIVFVNKQTKEEQEVQVWYRRKMRVEDAIKRGTKLVQM